MAATVTNLADKRSAVDIAELYAKLSGGKPLGEPNADGEALGFCVSPNHDDEMPSVHYNVKSGAWHCKVCDVGGSYIKLVQHALPELSAKGAAQRWLAANGFSTSVQQQWDKVDVTYDYVDEDGDLLLQVGRWNNPKAFGQRIPDGKGGWKYSLKDLKRRVPFALPALIRARDRGETIYVVEGEKDALNLQAAGAMATTNPQGAKWKWPIEWADFFAGASRVVVIADNDKAGREGAEQRAGIVARSVADVRFIAALPGVGEKGDVSDFIAAGGTLEQLEALADEAPRFMPYIPAYPLEAVDALVDDLSDTGNGRWFAACLGNRFRYQRDTKAWLEYPGQCWTKHADTKGATEDAVNFMRQAQRDYAGQREDDFAQHAEHSRSMRARTSMLESAQSPLGALSAEFDANPYLLNVANGTLDLDTYTFREHDPKDLITMVSPVEYDAEATCPNWEAWMMTACNGSQPLFDYMQEVMGSCLVGTEQLRRFFFIFGPKGTGKSTFIRTIEALLGAYQCSTDFKVLSETKFSGDGNSASPALARLRGKRMVSAAEARDSYRLDAARIKQLIGGDSITARELNQGLEEFKFQATLIMTGNEVPTIVGDESIWEKFKPVPFQHQLDGEDPRYEEKFIKPELSGILNWANEGLKRLRANDYAQQDPQEVIDARVFEMDAQDPFAEWFAEKMEKAASKAACDAVYGDYTEWCARNKAYAFKRQKLSRWLREKHGVTVEQSHGANKSYVGIRPKFKDGSASGEAAF